MDLKKSSVRLLVGKLLSDVTTLKATTTPATPSFFVLVLPSLKLRPFSKLSFIETTNTLGT